MTRDLQFEELLNKSFPQLSPAETASLTAYYELVIKWNRRISLTTITEPNDFVERHLGESYFASSLLIDQVTRFWDVGSGLGIPGIPVAILKPQLEVKLVESNRKKSIFLEEAIEILKLKQVTVMNVRFETLGGFDGQDCVAMRAVEKMERIAAKVVLLADEASQMLIFGGPELRIQPGPRHRLQRHLIPPSDERFVYELSPV